jgi:hypothetical protein
MAATGGNVMKKRQATLVAGLAALAAALAPGAARADTVCANATSSAGYQNVVGKGGDVVARLHYHVTAGGKLCTVLRAVKWEGTPHYMYVRSCQNVVGRPPGQGVNCSGWDAGLYRSYAGPIYWASACVSKVIVDSPSGDRVFNGWVFRCE